MYRYVYIYSYIYYSAIKRWCTLTHGWTNMMLSKVGHIEKKLQSPPYIYIIQKQTSDKASLIDTVNKLVVEGEELVGVGQDGWRGIGSTGNSIL